MSAIRVPPDVAAGVNGAEGGHRSNRPVIRARGAPICVGLGVLAGATAAVLVARHISSRVLLVTVLFLIGSVIVDVVRRVRQLPWWIGQIALLPWALIVLVPWLFFSMRRTWYESGKRVDISLPGTWSFHVMALLGMSVGTCAVMLWIRPGPQNAEAMEVRWRRLSGVLSGCMAVYLASFVLAKRPFAALWRLSGRITYADTPDRAIAFQILDQALIVGSITLLVVASVRRRHQLRPPKIELFWFLIFSIISLGTGSRTRLYLVVLGWLLIQFAPSFRADTDRANLGRRTARLVAGGLLVVVLVFSAQAITRLRSRGLGLVQGSVADQAMRDLDVVGTGELMFELGAKPGMLHGRSYTQLPVLVLPRRFSGGDKPIAAADAVMRDVVDRTAGDAAPFWLEAALNYGALGVLIFTIAYSAAAVMVVRAFRRRRGRLAMSFGRLGPIWLFISYLILARLTTYQCLLMVGTVVLGVYGATLCQRSPVAASGEAMTQSPLI